MCKNMSFKIKFDQKTMNFNWLVDIKIFKWFNKWTVGQSIILGG
jgi:hypothetical protein